MCELDAVISDLHNIGAFAQEYHRKPTTMEGGGYSFTGWTIPPSFVKIGNGRYTATVGTTIITIVGTGNEKGNDGKNKTKATAIVTPTSNTISVNN